MIALCQKILTMNVGVNVEKDDIAHVELRSVSSSESVFTKSIFIRFHDLDLRYLIYIFCPFYQLKLSQIEQDEGLGKQGPS